MSDPRTPIHPPDPPLLPEQPGAIAARFSVDEVAHLTALLGLTPPPSVASAVLAVSASENTMSTDDPAAAAVRRGLFERGVLAVDADGQLRMDDDVVAILSTICRPSMVLTVTSDRGTLTRPRTIYAMQGGAVVESPRDVDGQGVMDYMSLPIESIIPSVAQWTGLDDRPVPGSGLASGTG